jgi:hypothetical protein
MTQIFLNECRIYDGEDEIDAHKVLSLIERIIFLTKGDAKVQIDKSGEVRMREYFQGKLINIELITMQVADCVRVADKFGP